MESNLEFWEKVEISDPKQLSEISGTKLTSIDAYSQIKKATEVWGMYGDKWGFKELKLNTDLSQIGVVILNAVFFYPSGEFPIVNDINLKDGDKINKDFSKKITTDALTKALSMLGFNADVYLNKHKDSKFIKPKGSGKAAAKKIQLTSEMYQALKEGKNLAKITEVLTCGKYKFVPTQKNALQKLKNELLEKK